MENLTIQEMRTLQSAVLTYGADRQTLKAAEELGELIQALCKYQAEAADGDFLLLRDHISEEMADVYIMLAQMEIIYNNKNHVESWIHKKLERLRTRIDTGGEASAK